MARRAEFFLIFFVARRAELFMISCVTRRAKFFLILCVTRWDDFCLIFVIDIPNFVDFCGVTKMSEFCQFLFDKTGQILSISVFLCDEMG